MLAFVLRRLLQAVIVMLTVAFVAFMLFQYVGDPVSSMLGQDATPEQREQLRADLGLDAPFPLQFARFVGNAVRGDFGLSLRQGRKVSALIAERFPATLELSLAAAVIARSRTTGESYDVAAAEVRKQDESGRYASVDVASAGTALILNDDDTGANLTLDVKR